MTQTEIQDLKKTADLNWCIDILKRIEDIVKQKNISEGQIEQIHWLVKQGLKVEKEE